MNATKTITREFRDRLIRDVAEGNLTDLQLLRVETRDRFQLQQIEHAIRTIARSE